MKTNNCTQPKIKLGTTDVRFVLDGKTIRIKGDIQNLSDEIIDITLDVGDKNLTLPEGTDIYISNNNICYNISDINNFPEVKAIRVTRRKFVRVNDILKVDYQKVPQEDYNRCQNRSEIILNDIFGESFKMPEIEEVDLELLYKLIYQANLKIDRILDLLGNKEKNRYESVGQENVNISGSGMKFIAGRRFSTGDVIAIQIFLPLPSKTQLNLLGKVISVKPSDLEMKYEICVTFVDLTEKDREAIVKYVFQRQREIIRLDSHDENGEL